jgi:translation initiation factor IF-3
MLIAADGEQMGVMTPQEALRHSEEAGLDLVEVSPVARPPVCRIMDYGKYKYQQSKKAQETRKKKSHSVVLKKEVKLRPRTEEHDLNFKIRNAKKFLADRNKVKITIQFRGREMAYTNFGTKLMDRIAAEIQELGTIEQQPKLEGRFMTMVVAPKA